MVNGQKKFCRHIADNGRVEVFNLLDQSFRISAENWNSDETVKIIINEEELVVAKKEINFGENTTIYHEGIETIGGYCKEDEN